MQTLQSQDQVDFSVMLPNGIIQEVLEEYLKREFKRPVRVVAAKPMQDGYVCALAYDDPIKQSTVETSRDNARGWDLSVKKSQQYSQDQVNALVHQALLEQFRKAQVVEDEYSQEYVKAVGPVQYEPPTPSLDSILAQFEHDGLVKKHGEE